MTNEENMKIYDQYVCAALISICSKDGFEESDVLRADRVAINMLHNRNYNLAQMETHDSLHRKVSGDSNTLPVPEKTIFEH